MVSGGQHTCSTGCDHSLDGDRGSEFSLYNQVDVDNTRCLNEADKGSIKNVFKSWDRRLDMTKVCSSDADQELLIHIPFTGTVKLKSISIYGGPGEEAPSKCLLFVNKEHPDFDTVGSTEPDQVLELIPLGGVTDVPEYAVKVTKFSNVRVLTLYIPENFGGEATTVSYIGLKGEWTEFHRDPIITLYEAAANPRDHKTILSENSGSVLGQ